MRLLSLLLLCLLSRGAAAPGAKAPTPLPIHARYPASLFNLIEQLSGWNALLPASEYRGFWESRFGVGPEERRLLAEYVRIRRSYSLPVASQAEPTPFFGAGDAFELGQKWPLLFCRRRTLDDSFSDAELLLRDDDAASLRRVFAHFDARFRPVWERDRAALEQAARRFSAEGWDRKLADFAAEAAPLFGATPRPGGFEAALVWQPDLAVHGGALRGSLHGRVLLIQLPRGAGVEEASELAAHELIHGLFHGAPPAATARLQQALLGPDFSSGLLAWQGFDEGVATALGNGVFRARHQPERFAQGRAWYADADIDAYARAVYPVVDAALAEGRSLASAAGLLAQALKPLMTGRPVALTWAMRSFILVSDDSMRGVEPALTSALKARGVWRCPKDSERLRDLIAQRWAMPVVVLVSPERLEPALSAALDWQVSASELSGYREQARRGVLVVGSASARGRPYLLICGRPEAVATALPQIARLEIGGSRTPIPALGGR